MNLPKPKPNGFSILFLLPLLLFVNKCQSSTTKGEYLQIPSFGRSSHLGHLYNEILDQFLDVSMFTKTVPKEFITTSTDFKLTKITGQISTYQETFKLLEIPPNIAVNVLSGLTTVDGSAGFIKEALGNENILIQKSRTVKESLEIFYSNLASLYNTKVLNQTSATHVVTGILWGADIAVSFANQIRNKSQTLDENLEIEAIIKSLTGPQNNNLVNLSSTFEMTLWSDIPLRFKTSTNVTQVYNLLQQMPQLMKNLNNGKGLPMKYILTPLSVIRNYLGLNFKANCIAKKLNEQDLTKMIDIFDEINLTQLQITQLDQNLLSQQNCLLPDTAQNIDDLKTDFQRFEANFTITFKQALTEERSGKRSKAILSIRDWAAEYYEVSEFNRILFPQKLADFNDDLQRVSFCNKLASVYPNIRYFGLENIFEDLQFFKESVEKQSYVLFTNTDFTDSNLREGSPGFLEFFTMFNQPENNLVIVDCYFDQPICRKISQPGIYLYSNMRLVPVDEIETVTEIVTETTVQQQASQMNEMNLNYTKDCSDTCLKKALQNFQLNINEQTFKWVETSPGSVPINAVEGGMEAPETGKMYVARVYKENSVIPGKYMAKYSYPFYVYQGAERRDELRFEVLCAPSNLLSWVADSDGHVPDNAITGGEIENGGKMETMYIGRFRINEYTILGSILPSQKVSYVPYYGEQKSAAYEVLVLTS